ncbi:hypothetical protein HELRODRAFT_183664 [Helobdella robusta]|uniref:Uncharacterized protein n=1 Tax=Helobdella robusta TaxID=6412 RepID=T1FK03_HELRO|nr:hypothetical protein HELRODRAFT_183664 [Helobdella robusta]ESO10387.1 hypothetical protein HELRODRAFT_183664 [Helobdella robusta]
MHYFGSAFFIGVSILIIILVIYLFTLFFSKLPPFKYACGILQGVSSKDFDDSFKCSWKKLCGETASRFFSGKCSSRSHALHHRMSCIFMITMSLVLLLAFGSNNRLKDFETRYINIQVSINRFE